MEATSTLNDQIRKVFNYSGDDVRATVGLTSCLIAMLGEQRQDIGIDVLTSGAWWYERVSSTMF